MRIVGKILWSIILSTSSFKEMHYFMSSFLFLGFEKLDEFCLQMECIITEYIKMIYFTHNTSLVTQIVYIHSKDFHGRVQITTEENITV